MRTTIILSVLLGLLTCACNTSNDGPEEPKIINLDEKSAQLIEADNAFGFDLFQKIRENTDDENIMISPLSVSLALGMAYNGAEGETRQEMQEAMKLAGLSAEDINNAYKTLVAALQSLDEKVVFEIANAIFHHNNFPVKQSFLDMNKTYYDAGVDALNFASPAALEAINGWVADKTHDKITKILDDLSPQSRMVLVNAIYFLGEWTNRFDEDGTKMLPFTLPDGKQMEVETMSKMDKLEYTKNSLFSAVKLPYGDGQYNMVVLLPSEDHNSQDVIDELSSSNWKSWNKDFSVEEKVLINMPRFKFAFKSKLNNMLKMMGMERAFNPGLADFSNISSIDLFISAVIHKSFIDVNEKGTEAAAVTAVVFETTSAGPSEPVTYFNVNKPFVFAITEKDTDAILFLGQVQKPEYEE